jgi:hypothetical protein
VPGPATGANQIYDIEAATRFCVEVAKAYTANRCRFVDMQEWATIQSLYGSLAFLQQGFAQEGKREGDR